MSCNNCSIKFSVFKRKKQCCDCHRYYCGQCLSIFNAGSTESPLFQRITGRNLKCMICKALSKRPLMRSHLLQFRAKELQSYLMSQNISTRGCVEKEDLVNLLVSHITKKNPYSTPIYSPGSSFQERISVPGSSSGEQENTNQDTNSPPSPRISENASSSDLSQNSQLQTENDIGDFEMIDISHVPEEIQTPGPEPIITFEEEADNSSPTISNVEVVEISEKTENIKLEDILEAKEFETMTIKQLKTLLYLNRIDFQGCCEKPELIQRATRLWKEYKEKRTDIEKLGVEDLCKICMDAPVECVMLECGHLATCTACGKQLNECPICRQYVVRVVRTFRA